MKIIHPDQTRIKATPYNLFVGQTFRRYVGSNQSYIVILDSDDIVCEKALLEPNETHYVKIVDIIEYANVNICIERQEQHTSKISFEFIKKNLKSIMTMRAYRFTLFELLKENRCLDQQKLSLIEEQYRDFI